MVLAYKWTAVKLFVSPFFLKPIYVLTLPRDVSFRYGSLHQYAGTVLNKEHEAKMQSLKL